MFNSSTQVTEMLLKEKGLPKLFWPEYPNLLVIQATIGGPGVNDKSN